jgi:uncharacterized membrane protein
MVIAKLSSNYHFEMSRLFFLNCLSLMLICVADVLAVVLAVLDIRQLVEMETQDELIKPEGA